MASLKIPVFLIISSLFVSLCEAADFPDFELAWRVTLQDEDVGYSLSRFFYLDENTGYLLKEEGTKLLCVNVALLTINYAEETQTVWDNEGLVSTFTSKRKINGTSEIRRVERRGDGSLVWTLDKGGKTRKKRFKKGDFDFVGRDLYMKDICKEQGPVEYRILSAGDGKIYSITYRALGYEEIEGTNGIINCHKVEINGPMGDGVFLIHDMGLAISFSTKFFLGNFSFYPCKLSDVPDEDLDRFRCYSN